MPSGRTYYVYILTNRHQTVLYTGVTGDLRRRLRQHHEGEVAFTRRYDATHLLYFERYRSPRAAIEREKQLKGWTRQKKLRLIRTENPDLRFLQVPVGG
jgi:putative endonuclease